MKCVLSLPHVIGRVINLVVVEMIAERRRTDRRPHRHFANVLPSGFIEVQIRLCRNREFRHRKVSRIRHEFEWVVGENAINTGIQRGLPVCVFDSSNGRPSDKDSLARFVNAINFLASWEKAKINPIFVVIHQRSRLQLNCEPRHRCGSISTLELRTYLMLLNRTSDEEQSRKHTLCLRRVDALLLYVGDLQINRNQRRIVAVLRDHIEHFIERRNPFCFELLMEPRSRIERLEFIERHFVNRALPVRRSIDGLIMHADEMAIFAATHINLEANSELQTSSKIGERVFRCVLEQSAMRHNQRFRAARRFVGKTARRQTRRDPQHSQ